MRRRYNRRRITEARKEHEAERLITCDLCNGSYNHRHYYQYHQHHCKHQSQSTEQTCGFDSEATVEPGSHTCTATTESDRSSMLIEEGVKGCGASMYSSVPMVAERRWFSTHTEPKRQKRDCERMHTNLSDVDISSFFPEGDQDIEEEHNSDIEEHWQMPDTEHVAEDMEDEVSQDLYEAREQKESTSVAAESKAQQLVRWLCIFLLVWQARFFISDLAIEALLKFFKDWLSFFSVPGGLLALVVSILPSGIYGTKKLLGYAKDPFTKFVVCRKCYTLYAISDCLQTVEGQVQPKKCVFTKYPWQRNSFQKVECGEPLLKIVTLPSGNKKFYPFKWYCFRSLKDSLAEMVQRPGFEEQCEAWRQRSIPDGIQEDIMDGQIWKDFNGHKYDFFTRQRSYGLMLNVDWFRPFKHVQYSVGAIYLTVLNLPKAERFKRRNIILVGIIPHMQKEPKTNTFLSCLSSELKEAWTQGFKLLSAKENRYETFYLALLLIGCDIPACRKLCGFLGHAAYRGCSKCWKFFPGQFGERNYGGFARDDWPKRTHEIHIECCERILASCKRTEAEGFEREYGLRYSVFLDLPYLDIVQMHIVDPMHNLFLGTAKRMVEIWKQKGILSNDHMKDIQQKIDAFVVPSDLGNIPYKINSGFADFTADQWKNWTLYFSIPCLRDVLPSRHFEVWNHFVKACHLVCSHVILLETVQKADLELIAFCTSFEELYGSEYVTPNMHLHAHLKECIMNYGPINIFWLFSFERYNGILGNQPSNQRSVELQMMQRFLRDGMMSSKVMDVTEEERKIAGHLNKMQESKTRGALKDMVGSDFVEICRDASCMTDIHNPLIFSGRSISYLKKVLWDLASAEIRLLQAMYAALYPTSDFTVVPSCFKITQLLNGADLLGSRDSRSYRSSFIMAYWPDRHGSIHTTPGSFQELAAGQILYFIEHNLFYSDKRVKKHLLARVQWYEDVDLPFKNYYGFPVHLFYPKIYRPESSASFIPVQRIRCKILTKTETLRINHLTKDVLIAVPRDHFLGFHLSN